MNPKTEICGFELPKNFHDTYGIGSNNPSFIIFCFSLMCDPYMRRERKGKIGWTRVGRKINRGGWHPISVASHWSKNLRQKYRFFSYYLTKLNTTVWNNEILEVREFRRWTCFTLVSSNLSLSWSRGVKYSRIHYSKKSPQNPTKSHEMILKYGFTRITLISHPYAFHNT